MLTILLIVEQIDSTIVISLNVLTKFGQFDRHWKFSVNYNGLIQFE